MYPHFSERPGSRTELPPRLGDHTITACPDAILPMPAPMGLLSAKRTGRFSSGNDWPHEGEQDRLTDSEPGQCHHETVHAHAHAAGRRHPVLECLQEILVEHHRLGITRGANAAWAGNRP